jgi:hypothetical protein
VADDRTQRERGEPPPTVAAKGSSRDAVATVDLGPSDSERPADAPVREPLHTASPTSAFDPPADRFEPRGEIGRGGMGRVDDAFDRALGRPVAIKHMLSTSGIDLARFEREARITARLEHPGIVPIHDAGRSADGTPYYVMRRIDGRPLGECVSHAKTLADRLALVPNILAACDAVGFAHARGVVHRDLKPSNILIGPFGETLVIDWGLAREVAETDGVGPAILPSDPQLTRAGTVAGTPGFMAPEQARGEPVDARADVFALGATLFYLLACQPPYTGTDATEMVERAGAGRGPDWRLVPREIAPDLRAILAKALASKPADRYGDACAFAADLRTFMAGNLVGAYDYGAIARIVRYARRHRAALAVAAVSVLVLAVVATLSVRRVLTERDAANAARALAEERQRAATAMADGLLVQHAREVAESDPAGAVSLLRELPAESTRWPEAWAAASAAQAHGIPFGFVGDAEPSPDLVEIAGDSRHAFTVSIVTGQIRVFDLIDRTRRDVTHVGRTLSAAWLDPGHIACALDDRLVIVDVSTGMTRSIDRRVQGLISDRHGRIWMRSIDGHDVYELADVAGEPRTLLTGVDDASFAPDLSSAVIRRGAAVELWTPSRTWPVVQLDPGRTKWGSFLAVRGSIVSVVDDREVRGWLLRTDQVLPIGVWPRENYIYVVPTDTALVAISQDSMSVLTDHGIANVNRGNLTNTFATPTGIVAATSEGGLIIRDHTRWLRIGRQPAQYRRVDLSIDDRFVAAVTQTGDLLVWDLDPVRANVFALPKNETILQLTAHALWLLDQGEGVHRRDLTTGVDKLVLASTSPITVSLIDPDEHWASLHELSQHTLDIYDVGVDRVVLHDDAVGAAIDRVGITYVRSDGALSHWEPGWERASEVGALPEPSPLVAANAPYVAARLGERDVARFDTTAHALRRTTFADDVMRIALTNTGRVFVITRGELWQWDPPEQPVHVDTPGPVDDVVAMDGARALVHGPKLLMTTGSPSKIIAVNSTYYSWSDGALVAVLSPKNEVSFIDLTTGVGFDLPVHALTGQTIASHDDQVAFIYALQGASTQAGVWRASVPRDPAALRAWLGAVTNAKPIANSEAVAWP